MNRIYLPDKQTLDDVNAKVGTANDTPSSTPMSLFSGIKQLLSSLTAHINNWTAARAGKIDTIDTNAARLTATRAEYIDKLNNGTYGLQAIKNEVTAAKNAAGGSAIKSVQRGVLTIAASSYEGTATLAQSVNMSKAVVLYGGSINGNNNNSNNSNNWDARLYA